MAQGRTANALLVLANTCDTVFSSAFIQSIQHPLHSSIISTMFCRNQNAKCGSLMICLPDREAG